jgi:hypothetical protein
VFGGELAETIVEVVMLDGEAVKLLVGLQQELFEAL